MIHLQGSGLGNNGMFFGISAEEKPILPENGLMFFELDTMTVYKITDGVWSEGTLSPEEE